MPTVLLVKKQNTGSSFDPQKSTITDTYRVTFNSIASAIDAKNASGVPADMSAHPNAASLLLNKKTSRVVAKTGGKVWDVDCEYNSPDPIQAAAPSSPTSGDKWNVKVSVKSRPYEIPISQDNSGNALTNAIGEPYNATRTKRVAVITVSWQTNVVDWDSIVACRDKINSDSVTMTLGGGSKTFPAKTLLLTDAGFDATWDSVNSSWAFDVSIQMEYNPEEWQHHFEMKSRYHKEGLKIVPTLDDRGNEVSEPRYIDNDGALINAGDPIVTDDRWIYVQHAFATMLSQVP